ncbi:LLM class flavin-dependent oxidoreductase [Amycolatopsis sp. FDAARGOS 1241]|uniref:LLM class flavin-dependent oxidoreductase n=1 Tax=Amycolatopsis sp. FDAARGOS 1241 TaxID=2778070 RepID=UPI00195109A0|nr:LLM class flavin-dependent oxidoreductase [Amycolatopsis sp. FDAARGOS 1241]QRP47804.1 LLM class flavin-dependent oxidoreductase [Amycolatopsis sp. FDAARGOS 1241]
MNVGVCLPVNFTVTPPVSEQRTAVRRLEAAGYRTVWTNEVIGKDAFTQLAVLLGATSELSFGTCVANIWARPPQTAAAAAAYLAQAFPDRFTLGLGVGYPQQAESVGRSFGAPLSTMRDYLAGLSAETRPPASFATILGANGPKMLALAADLADGALPAGLPPEHTAAARRILGPDKLLAVGLSIADSLETARRTVSAWLARPSFTTTVAELGYPESGDELVRALVACGGPDAVAERVRAHLAAGADHVTLLPPIGTPFSEGIDHLLRLAPPLT